MRWYEKYWDLINSIESRDIPAISLPDGCKIAVIPPFHGAVARFVLSDPLRPEWGLSVHLDWNGALGFMDKPYWELYPNEHKDTERYYLTETDELEAHIHRLFNAPILQPDRNSAF